MKEKMENPVRFINRWDAKCYVLDRTGGSIRRDWSRHKIDALTDVEYEKFLHDLIDVVRDDIY